MQATRHYLTFLLMLCCVSAQPQGREKYEYTRNLPVYADSLIADLTYPLAWGNSDIRDFDVWKQAAREKVLRQRFSMKSSARATRPVSLRSASPVTTPFLLICLFPTAKVPSLP